MTQENKPLYIRIYDDLKAQILSGVYAEDQQLPTEHELAEQYGVSRITSKRALSELEHEGLIYRIRGSGSYVKKWEGQPASNHAQQNKIISLILPYVAANALLGYMQGATDYLESRSYYLTIHTSDWSKDKEKQFLSTLPRKGVSGIMLYPVSTMNNLDTIYALSMNGFPIVTIDQYYDHVPVSGVVSDNFAGGYEAVKRLVDRGHKKIAFVSSVGIAYRSSVRDRFYGYCKALRDAGLPVDHELIIHDFVDQYEHPERKVHLSHMLNRLIDNGVTAIQAEHDHFAVDLIRVAVENGVKVPEQLSIVGFDNHEISASIEIPVTTIGQNFYEIGRSAAEVIVNQIESGHREAEQVKKIPVEWIERHSTAAAPTSSST